MSDHISTPMIAWFLFVLIGGWLLANALYDLSASWLRERVRARTTETDGDGTVGVHGQPFSIDR